MIQLLFSTKSLYITLESIVRMYGISFCSWLMQQPYYIFIIVYNFATVLRLG